MKIKGINNIKYQKVKADHSRKLYEMPWWTDSHTILNDKVRELFPDSQIVSNPEDLLLMTNFIANIDSIVIAIPSDDVAMFDFKNRRCHDNVSKLLDAKLIDKDVNGFALSDDGLWRYHSWGLLANGKIVETTCHRIAYMYLE